MNERPINVRALLDIVGIDPERMSQNEKRQLAAQNDGGYIPILYGGPLTAQQEEALPSTDNIRHEYESHEKTLINGLRGAAAAANVDSDSTPSIRANTGTGTVAAPFGVKYEVFADKMPWISEHADLGGLDDFDADTAPLGEVLELALERSKYIAQQLQGSGITSFCFDTQGPFDAAHLVIGDEIFYAMYDEPERVHRLLDNCTRMISRATRLYKQVTGEPMDGGRHGEYTMKGGIRVCEDTSTLLNRDQIHEFVIPYTRKLLQEFGGGWIHYCGDNEHLLEAFLDHIPEYSTVNFGNPERHDLPALVSNCIDRGKAFLGGFARGPEEDIRAYFERVLSYTRNTGRGLLFYPDLPGDLDPAGAVGLWRSLQA
jgi:hypothetical protein